MRPWCPQIRSASAGRIESARVPTRPVSSWRNSAPQLPAIASAKADDGDASSSSSFDGDERRPRPLSPSPPTPLPPRRIETRGAKPGRTFSDETLAKMSRAKEGKVMPLETRLKISASRKGAVISDETKERMAETRRRWWANERKARRKLGAPQRGGTLPAAAATAAAAAKERKTGRGEKGPELDALSSLDGELDDPLDDSDFSLDPSSSLDLERAVAELSGLRAEVSAWISAFSAASSPPGRMPTRADAERSPAIYRKFIRFIALQDFVRSARGGGGKR